MEPHACLLYAYFKCHNPSVRVYYLVPFHCKNTHTHNARGMSTAANHSIMQGHAIKRYSLPEVCFTAASWLVGASWEIFRVQHEGYIIWCLSGATAAAAAVAARGEPAKNYGSYAPWRVDA